MEINNKISVILPVYNSEEYVSESITSILNQTYKNFELIIIDDGSTDNSKEICKNFIKKDNRIKYIFQENNERSAVRNNVVNHNQVI